MYWGSYEKSSKAHIELFPKTYGMSICAVCLFLSYNGRIESKQCFVWWATHRTQSIVGWRSFRNTQFKEELGEQNDKNKQSNLKIQLFFFICCCIRAESNWVIPELTRIDRLRRQWSKIYLEDMLIANVNTLIMYIYNIIIYIHI